MPEDLVQALFKDRISDILVLHHVSKDQEQRLQVHLLGLFIFWNKHVDVIVFFDLFEQSDFCFIPRADTLKLN